MLYYIIIRKADDPNYQSNLDQINALPDANPSKKSLLEQVKLLRADSVQQTESTERGKNNWPSDKFDYVHWDVAVDGPAPGVGAIYWDVAAKGAAPNPNEVFSDTRDYAAKRRSGYKMELDPLRHEYMGNIDDGDDEVVAGVYMTDKRIDLKAKYPKPA